MFCPKCNKKFSDFETICPTCLTELKDEFLTGSSPVSKVTPIRMKKVTSIAYSVRKQLK
jgi:predicted amidophosphoribosyltransferase